MALLSVGKKESAIKELEKIIKSEPNHVEALILMGKILIYLGRYKESSCYLWKVHSINPSHTEVKQYVSIMKLKMKECLEKANENVIKGKLDLGSLWCSKGKSLSII